MLQLRPSAAIQLNTKKKKGKKEKKKKKGDLLKKKTNPNGKYGERGL